MTGSLLIALMKLSLLVAKRSVPLFANPIAPRSADCRSSAWVAIVELVVVNAETSRVDRKVWVGSPIRDLAFADGTAYVLTSDRERGGAVSVIDMSTNRITDTIELGIGAPTQMTLSSDKTRAYVVDYDHVSVLCMLSHEVVTTITVDARPSCVTADSDGGRLYVADYAGRVTVFSVASTLPQLYSQLVATEPITVPQARELDPATV